jgi:histidine triad (HIT) family protein
VTAAAQIQWGLDYITTRYCPFCKRIKDGQYAMGNGDAVAFEPLNPVTDGHLLVVPRRHVADAFEDPEVTAETMRAAASIARDQYKSVNLITSVGAPATQTIRHLHVHIVPRRADDGLHLPWTGQQRR